MRRALRILITVVASMSAMACTDLRGIGQTCFDTRECNRGICVETDSGPSVCLLTCENGSLFCDNGEVCLPLDSGMISVCIPGGEEEIGDVCSDSFECVTGAICVDDVTSNCRALCEPPGGAQCEVGEVCTELTTGRGFCEVP